MKLVREHINEFERGGSALDNLGIGLFKPDSYEDSIEYAYNVIKNDKRFKIIKEPHISSNAFYYGFLFSFNNDGHRYYVLYWLFDHKYDHKYEMSTRNMNGYVIDKTINSIEDFQKTLTDFV
jgi:hypothetical protein